MYKIESEQDGGSGPKGPNFKLIVAIFALAIFVVIALVALVLPHAAKYMHPVNPDKHPTSQLASPGTGMHSA